ncbi:VWA domain-containing protein [Frankia sp. CNm7]|uniref:VWA domain-containing protein n=1 Tax=Frankia nepalensis TaxID=1836974 RepID=A0A937R9V7_9ACTN|nr:VWA domain-containing protein [Frankia nepalensis]MBL7502741.1 VWA domain-containing protein [Frankia nepalensis]MBL7516123.1 VWA domain-containing protein [Frankia nepalensis]MBL7518752.1 VWA domain-containing protein [Frankia nepalensis]MBL7626555.1 VWA domain-containing protein [Frankia nepalensis]
MSFLSAHWLWLLLAVAALLAWHIVVSLRRERYAARLASASTLASVLPMRPQWWRRHVPAALLLLTLTGMVVALGRPAMSTQVPRERATIMLAIDVSNSMAATDISPNRLAAAKQGAQAFVDQLPPRINLGLVSFSGSAAVLVPPTTDREAVRSAINSLQLGPATAIGEGIYASLQAITTIGERLTDTGQTPPPAAIVLISDGETTRGRPNSQAAQAAKEAHVPVDTIAYGTPNGTLDVGGQLIPVPVNEPALRQIADQTGGSHHKATSGDELTSIYKGLGSSIGYRKEFREVTPAFVGASLGLGLAAAAFALAFGRRLP